MTIGNTACFDRTFNGCPPSYELLVEFSSRNSLKAGIKFFSRSEKTSSQIHLRPPETANEERGASKEKVARPGGLLRITSGEFL